MELQKAFCMNGGSGDLSYARNCTIQSVIVSSTKAVRVDAVVEFYSTFFPENLIIAELGCSSGPNALFSAFDMMEAVEQRCLQLRRSPPEFHLLLNDLPANDFNTIFRSLPEFYQQRRRMESSGCGQFFVSGVPGSFYGRLFPSRTLHFVHSSSSLHWLSQVPLELQDKSNAPMNKGKIYLSKTSPNCVAEAYLMQFRKDFSLFLKCRAKEIVAGGHMVLTLMGRTRGSEPSWPEYSYMWELLGEALMDMASQGIIEEEKVDSFNAPYFSPSLEEVKQEIEREGSFSIRTLDLFEASWDAAHGSRQTKQEAAALGEITHAKRMAKGVRAVLESMLESHFGEGIMEELFSRYTSLLEGYYSRNKPQVTNIVIALTRKLEEENILRASVF
uniref:Jasmonate O-methyltransferase n=1 Tax=Musa acuminata subsp. malaccensis TaxID=214687 RepID=A0A804L706_MUSAM|nr:PREDICTED: jasmonate O-methyltransferase-like [Musa acuminata subsp. malaccensis]